MENKITLIDLCKLLKDIDSPLGDLCNDILKDIYFDYNDPWNYLDKLCINRYYIKNPYEDLKTIYNIINKI